MADRDSNAPSPKDVDRAAGRSHGDQDFGGHDAEAEGSAEAGIGPVRAQDRPKQAPADWPEIGED